ncbi:hypothetical protein V2J09_021088 [Rumex salicifolius]
MSFEPPDRLGGEPWRAGGPEHWTEKTEIHWRASVRLEGGGEGAEGEAGREGEGAERRLRDRLGLEADDRVVAGFRKWKWRRGSKSLRNEWMFSKMMRSAQIRFSDHSILGVIQILGKLGNWKRVLQVIEWLQMRERFKSHKLRYVYTAALDTLGKANRPVEALNLFRTMQVLVSAGKFFSIFPRC